MKKVLSFLSLVLVALAFVSCSKNTPEAVILEYVSDIQAGQYEDAIDLFYFKKGLTDEDKQQYATLFREKIAKEIDKKNGISSVEIVETNMGEDGNSATVSYLLKYGDGSSKKENSKLVKVDDKWKIESGK